ncbi:MAG: M14 family metallocarboxypeptidase [Deltaproteobacteria bacterium]|nr:M14 family metallocarboxypeptidase [Deltaproteobacteria bacterium]
MKKTAHYSIGRPLQKWGETEKQAWLRVQKTKRSYEKDVLVNIEQLRADFDIQQYEELTYDSKTYPLMMLATKDPSDNKPTVLITGGVHGYETSGVHGAIHFLKTHGKEYQTYFQFLVAPCVSPWSYETINRWNPDTIDPNRSFYPDSPAAECSSLMQAVFSKTQSVLAHFDLHETTDSDEDEFRPARAARDGEVFEKQEIPDGFYLVADTSNYNPAFQKAMIDAVQKITHIAPSDAQGNIIDVPIEQPGVILYDKQKYKLCAGFCQPTYSTTTEVYPDSPNINDEICIKAQVTAVKAGLDFILAT